MGSDNIASMNYLKENDAALCIFDKKDIEKQLNRLLDNPKLIIEYEKKHYHEQKKNMIAI